IRWQFAGVLGLALVSGIIAYPKVFSFLPFSNAATFEEKLKVNLGLDLQGGIHLEYSADTSQIETGKKTEALQAALSVIERRVNAFGVGESVIQLSKSGSEDRIIVELPGVKDIEEAKKMLKETPFLEFRESNEEELSEQIVQANNESKQQAEDVLSRAKAGEDFSTLATTYSQDPGSKDAGGDLDFAKKGMFVPEFDEVIFKDDFVAGTVYPELVESNYGWHVIRKIEDRGEGDSKEVRVAHILLPKQSIDMVPDEYRYKVTGLSGKNLKTAAVDYQGQGFGMPQVALQFDAEGAKMFADLTKRSIGKPIAIFLDGEVVSAPTVQSEIPDGHAVITGNYTLEEAKDLVKRLNEGALPVPITLVGQQSIDASLGEGALRQSVFAGLIGLLAVSVFMIFYYRFLGLGAVFALLIYSAMLLAIFRLSSYTPFPITLTLSGIAGFILSIGIAVDANVLIFERTREELSYGKSVRKSLEEGFYRAWPSIRDGHVSTLITTVVLMILGTGFVKGFAVILALGVLLSLFTAVALVHTWLRFVVGDWAEGHKAILVAPKAPPEDEETRGKHAESVIKKEIKNTEKIQMTKKKKEKHKKR
ncbi:MAG: protein translocase subunit SecD, partial [Candidatus Moranbacteria bacterium]|nr:protein translocase subunit SecD [Candidatus Moranbacteria bacterium]